MKILFFLTLFFINITWTLYSFSAQCNIKLSLNKENSEAQQFIKNGIYALHLQLANENFNSESAYQARAKIFDTILSTPFWSQKFSKASDFNIFWNWVRFQFWGLLQQQALLKEDQGFKIANDKTLYDNYPSILKFPIYPYPIADSNFICNPNEKSIYSCTQGIVKVDVLLSPALACDTTIDKNNLKFSYLVAKNQSGWSIIDIIFKGRTLILDSFKEYDNLINRYGNEKALSYLKFLINKVKFFNPTLQESGSIAFEKKFKIKAPKYPLIY